MSKPLLLQMFPEELALWLKELGQPAFRARQVFAWLHKGAGFDQMTNLPLALRKQLAEEALANPISVISRHRSQKEDTAKLLFSLADGHCVEGVLMRYRYGVTLCLSTQVGCRMGCAFCASTLEGLARNLTAGEMLGMVLLANAELKAEERVHNIVLWAPGTL